MMRCIPLFVYIISILINTFLTWQIHGTCYAHSEMNPFIDKHMAPFTMTYMWSLLP